MLTIKSGRNTQNSGKCHHFASLHFQIYVTRNLHWKFLLTNLDDRFADYELPMRNNTDTLLHNKGRIKYLFFFLGK